MAQTNSNHIIAAINNKKTGEVGGRHSQKGFEFQKYWAILHLFDLEDQSRTNYLMLFESLQDIAVLDSPDNPQNIEIFQIKKKETLNHWTLKGLAGINPKKISDTSDEDVRTSPIGKIIETLNALSPINCRGAFISNSGYNIALKNNSDSTNCLKISLIDTLDAHIDCIKGGFKDDIDEARAHEILSSIELHKATINLDDPKTYLLGKAHLFIQNRSPHHAAQAKSFIDALLLKITSLSANTDPISNITDLQTKRGFSKVDFRKALSDLNSIPDIESILESWYQELKPDKFNFLLKTQIKIAVSTICRSNLTNQSSIEDKKIIGRCNEILKRKNIPTDLTELTLYAQEDLYKNFPTTEEYKLTAHFLIQASKKCVAQI